jgi:outer membrane protein
MKDTMRQTTTTLLLLLLAAPAIAQEGSAAAPRQLTLDDALALAGRQNLDLSIARADVDVASTDVSRAFAGYLPRLDVTASGGKSWTGEIASFDVRGDVPATDRESYSATADLSQPLFRGFRTTNDHKSAKAFERAQRHLFDETELSVSFEVTRRFYELLKAERSFGVLEENARRSQELVDRADALFAAGKMPKNDTIQARVNLGTDQIALQNQRVAIQLRRSALATALGLPADEQLQVVAPPLVDAATLPSGEPPPLASLVQMAKAQRPLLASDAAAVESARAAIGSARADYFPQLSARASYGRVGAELTGDDGVFSTAFERQYDASAGVVLSWNLFEGGITRSNVQRAQANESRARANSERNDVLVAQQIADARAGVVWLTQTVKLAAANLAVAEQGVRLARERLEAGLLSQLEARDASVKLTQAQLTLVESRIDHAIAVADLNRAVGGAL